MRTLSASVLSENTNKTVWFPTSFTSNSLLVCQRGLNVLAIASIFRALCVKNLAATTCPLPCSKDSDLYIFSSASDSVSFSHKTDNFSMITHDLSLTAVATKRTRRLPKADTTFYCTSRVCEAAP